MFDTFPATDTELHGSPTLVIVPNLNNAFAAINTGISKWKVNFFPLQFQNQPQARASRGLLDTIHDSSNLVRMAP